MFRVTAASILCGLAAVAAGCRMCASTHDYCGPMCNGECGGHAATTARAGSILSGKVAPLPSGQLVDQMPHDGEITSGMVLSDEEMASGIILSVTDTKLEQPALEETDFEQPEVSETPLKEPKLADQGRRLEWQGWTASKPSDRRVR